MTMEFGKLTDYLNNLTDHWIPGLDMMIAVDGKTVYRHQSGFRDVEAAIPMDGTELYQAYSAAKLVTVTAALTLLETGRCRLSDPVYAYIPEFRELTVLRDDGAAIPAGSTMTLAHLFTMTSGIRYDLALPAIRKAVADTQGRAPTVEIARAIASAPLAFEPGSHFHYSLSHDVLAAVVEVITGMPFREYAAQAVLQPCGMTDSGFHAKETECSRFARQYRFDSDTQQAVPMAQSNEFIFGTAYDSGGAGLYSSVADLMCLMRMLTRKGVTDSGARILRAETVDAMRTNRLTPVQLADFGALRFAGYGYGLGVRTMMDRAGSGSRSSIGEFGWYGAAGIYLLADPEQKLAMCYAQQVRGYPLWQLHPVLRNLAYEALDL